MKFWATILIITFTVGFAMAQAPQAIPFQATARNANGVLLPNKTVSLRFTIHDATTYGTTVYQETQSVITNAQGLFLTNIGQGNVVSGVSLATINWSVNSKFIQIEMDTTNTGKVYRDIGTQQMLSVPYALNARRADSCNNAINAVRADNGVPVGTVEAYMGTTAPSGWMLCQGAALSRTTYAALFAVIGTSSGNGDGSTTFNVPDLRGRFLRGYDSTSVTDVDAASRTANLSGGASGNAIGTYQSDVFGQHDHFTSISGTYYNSSENGGYFRQSNDFKRNKFNSSMLDDYYFYDPNGNGFNQYYGGFADAGVSNVRANAYPGSFSGGSETRPKNVTVNYIIKL